MASRIPLQYAIIRALEILLADTMTLLLDFLPLALFLAAYMYKDIYLALIVLMIAMPVAVVIKYLRTRSLDKMLFWSTILLIAFGIPTLYFKAPLFLYWKPTVFYWAVAAVFLISQFASATPLAQRFFGLIDGFSVEKITAEQWRRLNLIWVGFFLIIGAMNIYVAYSFSEPTWVNFKVFGLTALTFAFMIAQTFWIANLIGDEESEEQE